LELGKNLNKYLNPNNITIRMEGPLTGQGEKKNKKTDMEFVIGVVLLILALLFLFWYHSTTQ